MQDNFLKTRIFFLVPCFLFALALSSCKIIFPKDGQSSVAGHVVDNGGDQVVLGFRNREKEIVKLFETTTFDNSDVLKTLSVQNYLQLNISVVSREHVEEKGEEVEALYEETSHTLFLNRARWVNLGERSQRLIAAHQILLLMHAKDASGELAYRVVQLIEKSSYTQNSKPLDAGALALQKKFYSNSAGTSLDDDSLRLKEYWTCRTVAANGDSHDFFMRFFNLGGGYTVSQREGFNANGGWSSINSEQLRAPLGTAADKARQTAQGLDLAFTGDGEIGNEVYRVIDDSELVFETSIQVRNPDPKRVSQMFSNHLIVFYGTCSPFRGDIPDSDR